MKGAQSVDEGRSHNWFQKLSRPHRASTTGDVHTSAAKKGSVQRSMALRISAGFDGGE